MDVKLPDGTIVKNIPDGTSRADLVAKLKSNGMTVPSSWEAAPQAPAASPSFLDQAMSTLSKYQDYVKDPGAQAGVAAHYLSGALAAPVSGLAGLAAGAGNLTGLTNLPAADAVSKVQNALTFDPKNPNAQGQIGRIDSVLGLVPKAGNYAGTKVADATGSPAAGTATNTFIQAIPMLLGGAKSIKSGEGVNPSVVPSGADVVKANTLAAAQGEGLVVPPSLTKNPSIAANTANGIGGIAETNKLARDRNTPIQNNIAAREVGLPADSQLTPSVVNGQIQNAVKAGYSPLKGLGDVPVDQTHLDAMRELGKSDRAAANIDPRLGNPQIAQLADALSPTGKALDPMTLQQKAPAWDSASIVDTISALRGQAADAYAQGNNALGKAYKQGANSLESLVDRHITAKEGDGSQALADFRAARTAIAKGHDVKGALNSATGDIDPRILARNDDGQLTGGLKTIADFAKAFPDAAAPSKGTPPGVTAFQANVEPTGGPISAATNLLGRPAARNYALSSGVQSGLSKLQPKDATLNSKALGAVFRNPTAFSAMYENQQ